MAVAKKSEKKGATNKAPAGTTNGNDEGGDDEGDEGDEEGLSEGQLALVNQVVGERIKRFEKKLGKTLEGVVSKTLAAAGIGKPADEEDDEGDEGDEGDDEEEASKKPAKPAKERAAKEPEDKPAKPANDAESRRLKKVQAELAKMREEREAEKRALAAKEERDTLREALKAAGVREELVGPLTTHLLSDDGGKVVRRDTSGKIVYVRQDDDGDEEEVNVKEGVEDFLKTDAGKAYLAPKGAGGSGSPQNGRGNGGTPARTGAAGQTREELNQELMSAMFGRPNGG